MADDRTNTEEQQAVQQVHDLLVDFQHSNDNRCRYRPEPTAAADILSISLPAQIGMLGLYVGTGHLDLRTWMQSGLLDIRKR